MKFIQKTWICVVVLATLLAFVNGSSIFGHDSENRLLSYMSRSNDLLTQDPTSSINCFIKYIPLINAIAESYETNFRICLNKSEGASTKADEATWEQRNALINAAEASCSLLKYCQGESTIEEIFQCFINGGSANIQTMYVINSNASQDLASLRAQYFLIKNNEYICTNATKKNYEKISADAYAGLNNCLLGNAKPEQISTTKETPTDVPTEPTEDTTKVEPETSDNPVAPVETTSENSDVPTEATEETETSETTEIALE